MLLLKTKMLYTVISIFFTSVSSYNPLLSHTRFRDSCQILKVGAYSRIKATVYALLNLILHSLLRRASGSPDGTGQESVLSGSTGQL